MHDSQRMCSTISPDLVIIQLGANDAAIDVWKDPPATKPRVDIATFRDNLEYFVRSLRKQNSKIILMTSNRFAWTPRLRALYGKPPYDVNSDDGFNFMLDTYYDAVRDIAHRREVELVDAAKAVPTSALLDGMHPSTEGHRDRRRASVTGSSQTAEDAVISRRAMTVLMAAVPAAGMFQGRTTRRPDQRSDRSSSSDLS